MGVLLPISAILSSAGLEVLVPNGQMFRLNWKLRLPTISFGLLKPLNQHATTTTTTTTNNNKGEWGGRREREKGSGNSDPSGIKIWVTSPGKEL